jgi:hypothetical protein
LEQQRQLERQQEELVQSIQYDTGTGSVSPPTSDSGGGSGGPPASDPGDDEDLPEIIIITELEDVYLRLNDELPWIYTVETDPDDVELEVEVEDEDIAEASFDGNYLFIYGLNAGSTRVTVTASKEGYRPAEVSFTVTVYEEYEEGDWVKSIIDEYGGTKRHADIALDSKGMLHIIYEDGSVRYRHWNGNSWQEEEPQIGSRQGSLTIAEIDEEDYSFVSYSYGGRLGYDVFNGKTWSHLGFGYESNEEDKGVSAGASSTNITPYYNDYWGQVRYGAGISYYDEANGDLYFRFNEYPENNNYEEWSAPFLVDGATSDTGKSSSLAFSYDFGAKDVEAYIAYYDNSNGGLLKLAVISDPLDPNPQVIEKIVIDDQVGHAEGQYVSLAVDDESVLHLAYYDAINRKLKYSRGFGEVWSTETVDNSEGDLDKYASLALDYEGNPHISYYAEDDLGGALKYARRDPDNEGEWLIEVIDQGEEVGFYTSIALDNNLLIPHFAYTAWTDEGWVVKHATRQGVMNTIEPGGVSGTEQAFENATFYIESFSNEVLCVREEYGDELYDPDDFVYSQEDQTITLKNDYLNNLWLGLHRIWIYFDYGLPVLITIEVTENLEAYIERSNPDVAYDPENNRYLMVYERSMVYYPPEIWGRFISADGEEGLEFAISEENPCSDPKVIYNPKNNNFLVTWSDSRNWEGRLIYAQILDDEGNPYKGSENFAVCPGSNNSQHQLL